DIVEVVSDYVSLKKSGRNYMGVCPFHSDKGPSLSVSREKQLYHCFGCGASGNVLGFIMNIKNMEFLDAIKILGDRVGISVESREAAVDPKFQMKDNIIRANTEAARYFFASLRNDKTAYEYLARRGIKNSTINKFGLGCSNNTWNSLEQFLTKKGFSKDILLKSGLIIKGKNGTYDRFRNRIIFPVFDYRGKVIGFGGRVLDDSKPKYLNSPESEVFVKGTHLYGLNFAIKDRVPESFILVEGYMDLIALSQAGITNVVATLGTALTLNQAKLIKKYVNDVFVCYDSDVAGKAATIKGMDILEGVGCSVRVIRIPKGKDPDEFIRNNSIEEFNSLVSKATPVTQYKINLIKEKYNLKRQEDVLYFTKEVVQELATIKSEVELSYYVKLISENTGILEESIISDVNKLKNKDTNQNESHQSQVDTKVSNIKREPAYKKSEQMLLSLCLESRDYFSHIRGKISEEEFITPMYKHLASIIFPSLNEGIEVIPNNILKNFNSQIDIQEASRVFTKEVPEKINISIIDDYINVLKKYKFDKKIQSTKNEIKSLEKNGEFEKATELINNLIILKSSKDY
ncbi:MAG: DNA primase, partial [Clostridium sp.]